MRTVENSKSPLRTMDISSSCVWRCGGGPPLGGDGWVRTETLPFEASLLTRISITSPKAANRWWACRCSDNNSAAITAHFPRIGCSARPTLLAHSIPHRIVGTPPHAVTPIERNQPAMTSPKKICEFQRPDTRRFNARQVCFAKVGAIQTRSAQVGTGQVRSRQIRIHKVRVPQIRCTQRTSSQIGCIESRVCSLASRNELPRESAEPKFDRVRSE